jgi:predicted DCC family thiol-disulfide oxidoreductase YuxK
MVFEASLIMANLEVLYNSECPICRREIEHYKRLSGDDVNYVEITADTARDWGLTEDQAAEKLHARCGDGVVVGVEAFVVIWQRLPYFRHLAPIVNFKPIKMISSAVYHKFLAPLLFAAHKRRRAKAK